MSLSNEQKEKIAIEVIKTLLTRFEKFPKNALNNRNAPFHESFLVAFSNQLHGYISDISFFISLSSWLHGLNTTLGQMFFEKIAHHLSGGTKKEFTNKKERNLQITQTQRDRISKIIADLSNDIQPNLEKENQAIFSVEDKDHMINAMGFCADILIEKDQEVIAIELKSVKPNSGEMKGEKQKILEGKAALSWLYPNHKISFYIAFPFDPTVNPLNDPVTSHDKTRFLSSIVNMNKYFDPNEVLIADDFWCFLSGQKDSMSEILKIIQIISTTTFLEKFEILQQYAQNKDHDQYNIILKEWCLYSELELVENHKKMLEKIQKLSETEKNKFTKLLQKSPFDQDANYRWHRYHQLKTLL
jgi:hypothetical protein